jgi:ADP-heptose:LPS heptosyltransferase
MGIGDELMAMGDAARLRGDREIKVAIGDGKNLYASPLHQNVPWLWQAGERIPADARWIISHPGNRPYCDYERMIREARERFGWKGGIDGKQAFQLLKRKYWRQSYHATPAPVVLLEWERATGRLLVDQLEDRRPLVLIEPNIKLGAPENKRWPFARYQQVINACKDRCTFVQFGRPLLIGAVPMPAQPIRSVLAMLSAVDAYVGTEGFLHHAAAALGKPAVVIFGGYINPKVTGYTSHQNLWVECEDEGCPGPTPAGEAALAKITVKQVVAALDVVLGKL